MKIVSRLPQGTDLEFHEVIRNGIFPQDLAEKKLGKLDPFRWLTTVNKILRLYLLYKTLKVQSSTLNILVKFIVICDSTSS